jgi:hypothetical protein
MENIGRIYTKGMVLKHPNKPEWGPGEVVNVTDTTVHIFFRDDPDQITKMFPRICPFGPIGWDGFTDTKMEDDIGYFAKPDKLYSLKELKKNNLPPRSSGIYGWYFDRLPPFVPPVGCTVVKDKEGWFFKSRWTLLYIGKAKNLKERIVYRHFDGKPYAKGIMSTLRLSLGCLLSDKLGLILYYPPESFGKRDRKLNKWLTKHVKVAWIVARNIHVLEEKAIGRYILPFNIKDNEHPFKYPLKHLRRNFKRIAKSGEKETKKFRKAYKDFATECRSIRKTYKDFAKERRSRGIKK